MTFGSLFSLRFLGASAPSPLVGFEGAPSRVSLLFGEGWRLFVDACGSNPIEIIGVLFGCVARKIDGPASPGGSIIFQGHLFTLKGHL